MHAQHVCSSAGGLAKKQSWRGDRGHRRENLPVHLFNEYLLVTIRKSYTKAHEQDRYASVFTAFKLWEIQTSHKVITASVWCSEMGEVLDIKGRAPTPTL